MDRMKNAASIGQDRELHHNCGCRQFARQLIRAALILSFLTACEAMSDFDRALYTVTDAVTEKDRVTGIRSLSLENRAQQIRTGNQRTEEILAGHRSEGVATNEQVSPSAFARLKRIFDRVHSVSHLRNEEWTVVLVDDPEINAFVTGGTYVFVNSAVVATLLDDEIAALVGHEIAHVAANHLFESVSLAVAEAVVGSNRTDRLGAAYSRGNLTGRKALQPMNR